MRRTITIEKVVGETPLSALARLRREHPALADETLCYAGRLDPMASGVLLVLIGDECKRQREYHNLDKRYWVEVALGVHSDTGDVLGRLSSVGALPAVPQRLALRATTRGLHGPFTAPYPAFSSKPVAGSPLFQWALAGRLDEIELPRQHGHVYRVRVRSVRTIPAAELAELAQEKIDALPPVGTTPHAPGADFRRTAVCADWSAFAEAYGDARVPVVSLTITCAAGTYMRSLAEILGARLGTRALALSINRTAIGRYRELPGGWGAFTSWY